MLVVTAPSMNGVSTTPDDVAEVPITPCTNSGTNAIVPNIAMATSPAHDDARRDGRVAQQVEGKDRLAHAPLDEPEDGEQHDRRRQRADDLARAPRVLASAPDERRA